MTSKSVTGILFAFNRSIKKGGKNDRSDCRKITGLDALCSISCWARGSRPGSDLSTSWFRMLFFRSLSSSSLARFSINRASRANRRVPEGEAASPIRIQMAHPRSFKTGAVIVASVIHAFFASKSQTSDRSSSTWLFSRRFVSWFRVWKRKIGANDLSL